MLPETQRIIMVKISLSDVEVKGTLPNSVVLPLRAGNKEA